MQERKKRKHFILVIHTIEGGGAERIVLNLARLLKPQNRVSILTFDDKRELEIDSEAELHVFDVSKYKVIPRQIRYCIIANRLDRFITNNLSDPDEDLFIVANLRPAELYLKHSKLCGAYLIHNTLYRDRENDWSPSSWKRKVKREERLYERKPCIAVSNGVRQDMLKVLPRSSVRTIYNPVIPSALLEKSRCAVEKQLPESYIIHVGRLSGQKRHDLLIEAYSKSNIQTPLVLLGKGELECSIVKQIKQLNLEDRIILAGFTKNPYPYIRQAKFMVLSSEFEGLPTVLLESVALGTPAVSFDCPSGPSEILPQKNLAPHLDVDSLARLISSADQNPTAFHCPLDAQFSDEQVIKQYQEVSSECLASKWSRGSDQIRKSA